MKNKTLLKAEMSCLRMDIFLLVFSLLPLIFTLVCILSLDCISREDCHIVATVISYSAISVAGVISFIIGCAVAIFAFRNLVNDMSRIAVLR